MTIAEDHHGRCINYRIAKTAFNQQTITIANELKLADSKVIVLAVDPGDVPTRLNQGHGKTSIDDSVRGIVKIIETATIADSKSFQEWTGKKLSL